MGWKRALLKCEVTGAANFSGERKKPSATIYLPQCSMPDFPGHRGTAAPDISLPPLSYSAARILPYPAVSPFVYFFFSMMTRTCLPCAGRYKNRGRSRKSAPFASPLPQTRPASSTALNSESSQSPLNRTDFHARRNLLHLCGKSTGSRHDVQHAIGVDLVIDFAQFARDGSADCEVIPRTQLAQVESQSGPLQWLRPLAGNSIRIAAAPTQSSRRTATWRLWVRRAAPGCARPPHVLPLLVPEN